MAARVVHFIFNRENCISCGFVILAASKYKRKRSGCTTLPVSQYICCQSNNISNGN